MLTPIHQTIPECHIQTFLDKGHYFTPCSKFDDKEEFRYGYCLFKHSFTSAEELQECVARTHSIPEVNQWIDSTGVSCWVRNIRDEARMWRDHGSKGPSIRVTMDKEAFVRLIEAQTADVAHGDVTYEGLTSRVRPQFLGTWRLGEASDAIHHLFFHKRLRYDWEGEFRAVLFSQHGQSIRSNSDLIYSVKTSPLGKLNPALRSDLRKMFGDRFIESEADQVAFDSRHSNEIDETLTSGTLEPMFKELRRLEAHSNRIGRDWNNPKSSQPIGPVIEVTAKIHELKRAILAEQVAMKNPSAGTSAGS
jgi:hypothetical protein